MLDHYLNVNVYVYVCVNVMNANVNVYVNVIVSAKNVKNVYVNVVMHDCRCVLDECQWRLTKTIENSMNSPYGFQVAVVLLPTVSQHL